MSNPFALLDGSESEEEEVVVIAEKGTGQAGKTNGRGRGTGRGRGGKREFDRRSGNGRGNTSARKDGVPGSSSDDLAIAGEHEPYQQREERRDFDDAEEEESSEDDMSVEEYNKIKAEERAAMLAKFSKKAAPRRVVKADPQMEAMGKKDEEVAKEETVKKVKNKKGTISITEFIGKEGIPRGPASRGKGKGDDKGKGKGKGGKGKREYSDDKGKGKGKKGKREYKGSKGKGKDGEYKGNKGKGKGNKGKGERNNQPQGGRGPARSGGGGGGFDTKDETAFPSLGGK